MELIDIPGIGPKMIQKLNKLNIYTITDLLSYYPYDYNYYNIKKNLDYSEICITVEAIIISEPRIFYIKKNLNRMTFKVECSNKLINVSIF